MKYERRRGQPLQGSLLLAMGLMCVTCTKGETTTKPRAPTEVRLASGANGDRDADGIRDHMDLCPNEAEDLDEHEDDDGCDDPDNDGDLIADKKDLCPDDAEDRDHHEDEDGCPDPDNDGDHIKDDVDLCPNEREVYNTFEDDDGCPDATTVEVLPYHRPIGPQIFFSTNSSQFVPGSNSVAVLDAVVAMILGNPQLELVACVGRASASEKSGTKLSLVRADAVCGFLINKGVDASRLRSVGFGAEEQIETKTTPASANDKRRVDLEVLRADGVERVRINGHQIESVAPGNDNL